MNRHLTPADYTQVPWANGLGTTIEMLRIEEGGLKCRLSRASVVQGGAFSIFPHIERNLTVITGPGFDLVGDGIFLRADPLQPIAFAGDISIAATGVTAACDDFNVMTARHLPKPEITVLTKASLQAGGQLALFALKSGRVDGQAVGPYGLILTDRAAKLDGHFIAARLFL